jgi:hypothetical protein
MPIRTRYFFAESKNAHDQITAIFDFISPALAALWNLRWQVRGYIDTNPHASPDTLEKRFVLGSGVHGANLRRACVNITWEQQQEEMATVVLVTRTGRLPLPRGISRLGGPPRDPGQIRRE